MLDFDYPARFGQLIQSLTWDVELPSDWRDYFDQRGPLPQYPDDERASQRLMVRTHGVMFVESTLPFLTRDNQPVGVYTRDFSRNGTGFLTPFEIFPEERVRIILPTFWVQVRVARCRRLTSKCYEVGATLDRRRDPSEDAFELESMRCESVS